MDIENKKEAARKKSLGELGELFAIKALVDKKFDRMKGNVRIVCNSQLQTDDLKFIKDEPQAMKLEWCGGNPEEELGKIPERLKKLYQYLITNKIEVRVLPNDAFGL